MFSDDDLELILRALREGAVYRSSSSGGRYATTVTFRDGAFSVDRFEEGATFTARFTDAEMRAFILRDPDDTWLRILVDARAAARRA